MKSKTKTISLFILAVSFNAHSSIYNDDSSGLSNNFGIGVGNEVQKNEIVKRDKEWITVFNGNTTSKNYSFDLEGKEIEKIKFHVQTGNHYSVENIYKTVSVKQKFNREFFGQGQDYSKTNRNGGDSCSAEAKANGYISYSYGNLNFTGQVSKDKNDSSGKVKCYAMAFVKIRSIQYYGYQ